MSSHSNHRVILMICQYSGNSVKYTLQSDSAQWLNMSPATHVKWANQLSTFITRQLIGRWQSMTSIWKWQTSCKLHSHYFIKEWVEHGNFDKNWIWNQTENSCMWARTWWKLRMFPSNNQQVIWQNSKILQIICLKIKWIKRSEGEFCLWNWGMEKKGSIPYTKT